MKKKTNFFSKALPIFPPPARIYIREEKMTEEKIIPWEKLPITNTFMFNKVMTSDLD
ncbi:MAG: hypothetical protein HDR51_03915, partial [Treponema sp.]|nr:hypothetical protein [Treponema sp.]